MAEPNSIAATAAKSAASGGAVAAVAAFDPISMAIGLVAALNVLLLIPPPEGQQRAPVSVFLLVACGSFMAGALVPVVVAAGLNYYPWLATAGMGGLSYAAAAAIGAAPHMVGPLWRAWRATRGGAT